MSGTDHRAHPRTSVAALGSMVERDGELNSRALDGPEVSLLDDLPGARGVGRGRDGRLDASQYQGMHDLDVRRLGSRARRRRHDSRGRSGSPSGSRSGCRSSGLTAFPRGRIDAERGAEIQSSPRRLLLPVQTTSRGDRTAAQGDLELELFAGLQGHVAGLDLERRVMNGKQQHPQGGRSEARARNRA